MRLRPRRLVWRIYLHGLMGLVVFALSVMALFALWRGQGPLEDLPRKVQAAMPDLVHAGDAELKERFAAMAELANVEAAVYTRAGLRITGTDNAPAPMTADDGALPTTEALGFRRNMRHHFAVPLAGSDRYILASWRRKGLYGVLFAIGMVLLFLGMLSIPTARAVARPLTRLTETARALGDGDLSVRTGLCRVDEIGELARAMDDMAERLQRLLARERELLADISHELRTPLARIRVALELQTEDMGPSPYLEGVEEDLTELEGLVSDVLTSARLDLTEGEAGFAMRPAAVELSTLIEASRARFTRRHGGRTLTIELADGLPRPMADQALVRRVVDNLLDNAAKYSEAPSTIELLVSSTASAVQVEVRDRGVGLDPEDVPHLFDAFFRADRSRTRATGGVGLGLTLCKRIVDAHGGGIEGQPREGGGAVFRFTLPVDAAG